MDQHGSHHNQHPFGYGDFSSSTHQGMQSLEPSHDLMGLQAGMELLGIPSKQEQPPEASWRGMFFSKAAGTSSSGGAAAGFSQGENLIMFTPDQVQANSWQQQQPNPWQQQQELLRFPIERNENPTTTEGLSLALCNHEPTAFHHAEGFLSQTGPASLYQQQPQKLSSKYLFPAQELLNEFCSLDGSSSSSKHRKSNIPNKWEETSAGSSSFSSWNQSLNSLEFIELQKRKSRLLSMLEEVDRRYRKYCDQMRAVTSAFEAVAGEGAATVYSTLASKAMSRHFRCLRDGIVGQIKATKMAMGEKDPATPGSTRGETPRLRLLDQCIRQQKAFQQAGVIENHPWRPQRGLPERSVSVLRAWLFEHFLHPYPSDVDKHILARQTGLSRSQVSNWFINARVRLWKPMVEEMYVEETKEQDNDDLSHAISGHDDQTGRPSQLEPNQNPNPSPGSASLIDEQKPLMNDSDSLASIINNNRHHYEGRNVNPQSFGTVDLDFSSYNNNNNQSSFGNGVSLTLGLQQHNGGGMTLSFSPASQSSLFFSRETNMDECQPVVQFPIIDGDQAGQNQLPYRNMMGAQLLHDLAG